MDLVAIPVDAVGAKEADMAVWEVGEVAGTAPVMQRMRRRLTLICNVSPFIGGRPEYRIPRIRANPHRRVFATPVIIIALFWARK